MTTQTFTIQAEKDLRFTEIEALIVKVTHRCNLDCSYCYEDITKTGNDMELSVFKKLVDKVLSSTNKKSVQFIFHGGEPTLVNDSWYAEAIPYALDIAKQFCKQVTFGLQSNLVRLTKEKIELFKKFKISVGVSIDGPSNMQESMRGKANLVCRNFKKLQEEQISSGILMTINQSNFDKFDTIMKWLENEMHVSDVKINVVSAVGKGYSLFDLKPEQIFEAQYSILEYMINTKGRKVIEQNLERELRRFFATDIERSKMSKSLCNERNCGAGKRVVGITPTGDILPCGRFQWNDESYFLSKLNSEPMEHDVHSEAVYKFHSLVPENWLNCDVCEAKKVCNFGCQSFIARSKSKINVECLPTKMRYEYYVKNSDRLRELFEFIKLRNQLKREALDYTDTYNDGPSPYNDYADSNYADYSDKGSQLFPKMTLDYTDTYSDGPSPYNDYYDSNYADYSDKG